MSDESGKAAPAKVCFHQQPPAPARLSRNQPAQLDPHVQQKERERAEQEAVSRVSGRRPPAQLARTPVARFAPEAAPVLLSDRFGRHRTIDENEDQPLGFFLFPSGSFGGGEGATNRHWRLRRAVFGTRESVFRDITLRPHTQGTHATRLASDGTGHDGSVLDSVQEFDDFHSRTAAIQIERARLYFQGCEAVQEKLQDRRLVSDQTRINNRLTALLKGYFPQVLQWFPDIRTMMVCDFLLRWTSLDALKGVRRTTLEKFFREHHSQRQETIEKRLAAITAAVPLTTDKAVLNASVVMVKALAAQMQTTLEAVREFEQKIAELCQEHEDFESFASLPGAGKVYASRLLVALGSRPCAVGNRRRTLMLQWGRARG